MSVATGRVQATFCATFVDELLLGGVRDCVICPGSRSTPLVLGVASSSMKVHVRLDERSAGFFALGLARITQRPVLIVVTSGTAAAELFPAVVEANLDRVPLIVATADRPPELYSVGSPQTIDQHDLYGSHAVFSSLPGPCHAWPQDKWRVLASRAVLEANGVQGRRGPVHLNIPFSDPLVAEPDDLPASPQMGQPYYSVTQSHSAPDEIPSVGATGVVIVGHGGGDPDSILSSAERLGWPLFADPRSGCRGLSRNVIITSDGLLRSDVVIEALVPETIVLIGAPLASKVVNQWIVEMAHRGVSIVVLGPEGPLRHPTQVPALFCIGDADDVFHEMSVTAAPAASSWMERWEALESAAQRALEEVFADGVFCEPSVARRLTQLVEDVVLVSSSSMPIRDLEWFGTSRRETPLVLANRGANGIDGVVSTAMGVAMGSQLCVVALVGDLAFFHDISSLVDGITGGASLVVVIPDNNGGGIFSFLLQRQALGDDRFEQLFGTPRSPSVAKVARGFLAHVLEVCSHGELEDALASSVGVPGIHVIVASMGSRDSNVARHDQLNRAIEREALSVLTS